MSAHNGNTPAPPAPVVNMAFTTNVVVNEYGQTCMQYAASLGFVTAAFAVPISQAVDFAKEVLRQTEETVRLYNRRASGLVLPGEK